MELLNYLNDHFYTKQKLLELCKIKEEELTHFQQNKMMPQASYRVELTASCDSFFGTHKKNEHFEYYAKGYASWLTLVQELNTKEKIYQTFSTQYTERIKHLKKQGHDSDSDKVNAGLNQLIEHEWEHFLDGTYGLCTRSGLPEDIASKEFAILEIQQLIINEKLNKAERIKLTKAVNLLDEAAAIFAPHERNTSSRQRFVNDVRHQYQL